MSATIVIFFLIGLALTFLPVRVLLRFDRKLGYLIYRSSESEAVGLRRARFFYSALGLFVMAYFVWFALHV